VKLSNRFFRVFLGDQCSRWRRLNNGLPQGSVLAPILFNLYLSDIPSTTSKLFQYADDIAMTFQSSSFEECETSLESDLVILNQFFRNWRLQPNPSKTEMCVFHLGTHDANRRLKIQFDNTDIQHVDHPKYLGVTLDRTLTFKTHLEKTALKVNARVNILRKLTGTNWGSCADTLKKTSLALVFSTAEYCAPVWLNSAHVHKVDVQLNNTMRLITGTIKSTDLRWLPVLSNIAPPKLRREAALFRELKNSWIYEKSLLYTQLQAVPPIRLRSRKPIWLHDPGPTNECFDILQHWRDQWSSTSPANGHLIIDPTVEPPGFNISRHEWVLMNRFRTGQGKCAYLMNRWGFADSENCDCGHEQQTMEHIINDCPLRAFDGGLEVLHDATPEAIQYLRILDLNL
jgi:Reverse transcriptase (RNA-dependent DNA polymerase)